MPTVVIKPLVKEKINTLFKALLEGGYFSQAENALAYCDKIEAFVFTIPRQTHRKTKNARHGEFYATFKPNRRTTWYITFDVADDVYLVRNVLNNHTKDYPRFIAGLT